MIPRPTTAQLIQQCRREIMDNVLPTVTDETLAVALEQVQMVLDTCALRAESEIADMTTEISEMLEYAQRVVDAHPDAATRTADALGRVTRHPSASLRASDVGAAHDLASEAFSCAIEDAMDAGDDALVDRGVQWMASVRHERELAYSPNWGMPGRG